MTESERLALEALYGAHPQMESYSKDPGGHVDIATDIMAQPFLGFIEGATTIGMGNAPQSTAGQIARNLGSLGGFVMPWGVPGKVGALAKVKVAAPLMRGLVGVSKAAKVRPQWAVKLGANMLGEAIQLGSMSAVSNWQGGVDAMLHGAVGGGEAGAAFQALSYIPDIAGWGKAKGIARILATSAYLGLPPMLKEGLTPDVVYEYVLGGYFGRRGRAHAFAKTPNARAFAFDVEMTYHGMSSKNREVLKENVEKLYKEYSDLDYVKDPIETTQFLRNIAEVAMQKVPSAGSLWWNPKTKTHYRIENVLDNGKYSVTPVKGGKSTGHKYYPLSKDPLELSYDDLGKKVTSIKRLGEYVEKPVDTEIVDSEPVKVFRPAPTHKLIKSMPELALQYTGKDHVAGKMVQLVDIIDSYTGRDYKKAEDMVGNILSTLNDKNITTGKQFIEKAQPQLSEILTKAQKDGLIDTSHEALLMNIWQNQKNTRQYGTLGQYDRGTLDLTDRRPKFISEKRGPWTNENKDDFPGFLATKIGGTNRILKLSSVIMPAKKKVKGQWIDTTKEVTLGRIKPKEQAILQQELAKNGLMYWVNREANNDFNVVKKLTGKEMAEWGKQLRNDMYEVVGKKEVDQFFLANKERLDQFATVHKYNTLAAGPSYLKEFSDPVGFIKRVQGMEAKGAIPENDWFEKHNTDENGNPKIEFAIIQDPGDSKNKSHWYNKLVKTEASDGKYILEDAEFERIALASGEDPSKPAIKGFVMAERPGGTIQLKVAMFKASSQGARQQEFLKRHSLKGMVYSSGAKMQGGIKPFELTDGIGGSYDLSPATTYHTPSEMRIQYQSAHHIINPHTGEYHAPRDFVYQRMPGFAGKAGQKALRPLFHDNAEEINRKLREVANDPKAMSKWLKEEVFGQREDEMDFLDMNNAEYVQESTSTAERIAKIFNYDPIVTQMPGGGNYIESAIKNWVVRSILKPKVPAYDFVLSGLPEDVLEQYKDKMVKPDGKLRDDVVILGEWARDIDVMKDMENIYLVDQKGRRIRNSRKVIEDTNTNTLGQLFDTVGDKYNIRMVIARSPIENKSGVVTVELGGFGPKSSGNLAFMSDGLMQRLGGADNDIDKIRAWWTLPKDYVDEVKDNIDYLGFENKEVDRFLKSQVSNKNTTTNPKIKLVDPQELMNQGIRNVAAKDAIGKVFALDRGMMEIVKKGMLDIPEETYDRIMMYYKRRMVDSAKYGGAPPWAQIKEEILGHLAEAEVHPEKYSNKENPFEWANHITPRELRKEIINELDLYNDMFQKVFSRDIQNNRPWSWDEMANSIKYFEEHKTPSGEPSLFEFMATSVGKSPVSKGILGHVDFRSFKSNKDYFNEVTKGYQVPAGGDKYAQRLFETGTTHWDKFQARLNDPKFVRSLYNEMVSTNGKFDETKFFKLTKSLGLDKLKGKDNVEKSKHLSNLLNGQHWLRERIGTRFFNAANQMVMNDIYAMAAYNAERKRKDFVDISDGKKRVAENAAKEIFELRNNMRGKEKPEVDRIKERITAINEQLNKAFENDTAAREYSEYRIISGRPEPTKKSIGSSYDIVSTLGFQDFGIVRESIVHNISSEFLNELQNIRDGETKDVPVKGKKGKLPKGKKYYVPEKSRGIVKVEPRTPEQEKLVKNLKNNPEFSKHFVQFASGKLGKNVLDDFTEFNENDVRTLNRIIDRINNGTPVQKWLKGLGFKNTKFYDFFNTFLPESTGELLMGEPGYRIFDPALMRKYNGEPLSLIKYLQEKANSAHARVQYKVNSINNYHKNQMEVLFGDVQNEREIERIKDFAIAKWEAPQEDANIYRKVWEAHYQKEYMEATPEFRERVDTAVDFLKYTSNLMGGRKRGKKLDVQMFYRDGNEIKRANIEDIRTQKIPVKPEMAKLATDILDDYVSVEKATDGKVKLRNNYFGHSWRTREERLENYRIALEKQAEAEIDPVKQREMYEQIDEKIAEELVHYDDPIAKLPTYASTEAEKKRHYSKNRFLGNLMKRDLHVQGYRRDFEVLSENYGNLARKQYLDEFADISDKVMARFEKHVLPKLENPEGWKKFHIEYIRDVLSYPVRERRLFNFDIGDNKFMEDWNKRVDKYLGGNSTYKIKTPQDVRRISRLEGIYELASLLYSPKALSQNVFGGTVNNIVYGGFGPVNEARKFTSALSRGSETSANAFARLRREYNLPRELEKKIGSADRFNHALQESGVVTEMIAEELKLQSLSSMSPREVFSDANKKIFDVAARKIRDLVEKRDGKKLGGTEFRKEVKSILAEAKLDDVLGNIAGTFMKEGEWYLRKQSFLTGYLYAFKNNLVWGDTNSQHKQAMEWGKKFVQNTQYLYSAPNRPPLSNSAVGQIFYRFKQWSVKQIQFQNQIIRAARERGFEKGTPEYERFERMMLADTMLIALSNVFLFSLFDNSLPSPLTEIQDMTKLMFGNEDDRREAFFGTYGTSVVTPPIARLPVQAILALSHDDWKMFTTYHLWAAMPFGRAARDVKKIANKPSWAVETLTGVPIHQAEQLGKKKRPLKGPRGPISGLIQYSE